MPPIFRYADHFPATGALIGVVHLKALPGAPHHRLKLTEIRSLALADARTYLSNGVDGLIVENFGDAPFHRDQVEPHVVAAMAILGAEIKELAGRRPVGINVLRNAGEQAIGIASASGCEFVRINVLSGVVVADQGLIAGDAARWLRYRAALDSAVGIFADLRVKHATPLREATVEVEVEEMTLRGGADAILVTGPTTGRPPTADWLEEVAAGAHGRPLLVASGVDAENVKNLAAASGFVVGSSLKHGGRIDAPVDGRRVRALRKAIESSTRSRGGVARIRKSGR